MECISLSAGRPLEDSRRNIAALESLRQCANFGILQAYRGLFRTKFSTLLNVLYDYDKQREYLYSPAPILINGVLSKNSPRIAVGMHGLWK